MYLNSLPDKQYTPGWGAGLRANFINNAIPMVKNAKLKGRIYNIKKINEDNYEWIVESINKKTQKMINVEQEAVQKGTNTQNKKNGKPEEGEIILYCESLVELQVNATDKTKWVTDHQELYTTQSSVDGLTEFDQKVLINLVTAKYERYEERVVKVYDPPKSIKQIDATTGFIEVNNKQKADFGGN